MINDLIQELITSLEQKNSTQATLKKIKGLSQDELKLASTTFYEKFIATLSRLKNNTIENKINAIWPYFLIFPSVFQEKTRNAIQTIVTWVIDNEKGEIGNTLASLLETLNKTCRSFLWINTIYDIATAIFINKLFPYGIPQEGAPQIEISPPFNDLNSIIDFFNKKGLDDSLLKQALRKWRKIKINAAYNIKKLSKVVPENPQAGTTPANHTEASANNAIGQIKKISIQGPNFKEELLTIYTYLATPQLQHNPDYIKQIRSSLLKYFRLALRDLQHRLAFDTNNHVQTNQKPAFIITKLGFFKLIRSPGRPSTASTIAGIWYEFIKNERRNILEFIDTIIRTIDHKHKGGFWRDDATAKYYGDLFDQLKLAREIALLINKPVASHYQTSSNIS